MVLPTDPVFYLAGMTVITLFAAILQIRKSESDLAIKKKEVDQKIYETLILREISQRIGYELNLHKILDTIVDSLNKLLPFSVVSYMLASEDQTKINLRYHLEQSVNRKFLNDMRNHMLQIFNQTTGRNYTLDNLVESTTGTIIDESIRYPVASLWVAPLRVDSSGFGVVAIGSKKAGLYKGTEMEALNQILAQANQAVSNLEKVLGEEEEKVNSMVASMADGVLMLDANMGLVVINPAAARLLGLATDKKLTILDIAGSLSNKLDLRTKIDESVQKGQLVVLDNLQVGDKISQLLISPVKGATGKLLGSVVLFHDTSAQKELERVRDEFTAMMVHELRAPLTVVQGTTDMFLKDPQLVQASQGVELLKTMQNSSRAMLALVSDLLDVSKIEAGKFQVMKTKGNLSQLINDRINFFAAVASSKSINLYAEGLDKTLELEFDPDRISQVLNNLISNALKFTPMGGMVYVSAYTLNTTHDIRWRFVDSKPESFELQLPAGLVAISDTGIGISPERTNDLFSKFKQLQPSIGQERGTGLGLVIAKGIVETHGGKIFMQSHVNEGTTFYFTLPALSR